MKAQQALSDEQERLRIEGLRVLARIIARRALADAIRSPDRTANGAAKRTRAGRGADPWDGA